MGTEVFVKGLGCQDMDEYDEPHKVCVHPPEHAHGSPTLAAVVHQGAQLLSSTPLRCG
jgi:hypothetical protein